MLSRISAPLAGALAERFIQFKGPGVFVYIYLTMTVGSRAGTNFLLDSNDENCIGRGLDGTVVLTDPLCSRVHAIVVRRGNAWHVRDAESRNGTFVNDQKIDEAVLAEGHHIRT